MSSISRTEKRNAGMVGLRLTESDVEQLEKLRVVNGMVLPASTIAYHCFLIGLRNGGKAKWKRR